MSDIIFWNSSVNIKDTSKGFYARAIGPYQASYWVNRFNFSSQVIDFTNIMTTEQLVSCTEKFITEKTKAIVVCSTFPFYWVETRPYEPKWVQNARPILEKKYPNIEWILIGTGGVGNIVRGKNLIFNWNKIILNIEDNLVNYLQGNVKTKNEKFHISKLDFRMPANSFVLPHEVLLTELARGCQYSCKFCSYPNLGKKKNTYLRNFEHVRNEFMWNYEKFGVTRYAFCDSTFNESDEKLEEFAKIVKSLPFKLEYIAYIRLDLVASKPGQAELLKETGLKSAFFGIESFNKQAAQTVGKTWNALYGKEWLLKLRNEIWKDDINFHLSFIMGLPEESKESSDDTIRWCNENNIPSFDMRYLILDSSLPVTLLNEFERDPEKYGYSFPNITQPKFWVNKHWNQRTVQSYSEQVGVEINQNNRLTMWNLSTLASLGHSFDEIMWLKQKDCDFSLYSVRAKELVNQYVTNLLK